MTDILGLYIGLFHFPFILTFPAILVGESEEVIENSGKLINHFNATNRGLH